ncbi:MAG: pyruvate formate lyase family protein [candidate division WOR-3 bacterium]
MSKVGLSPRISRLVKRVLNTKPSVCLEKAKVITEMFMKTESEPLVIRRAKAFAELCKRKTIFIDDDELIVGHPASRKRAAILDPEASYWILSEELDTLSQREIDPYILTEDQKKLFKEYIEPYWRGKSYWDTWILTAPHDLRQLIDSGVLIFICGRDAPVFGLVVPNYELIVKEGIKGIRERINAKISSLDLSIPGDYERWLYLRALSIVCDGIAELAKRYSLLAKEKAGKECDPQRRIELEKISEICEYVPVNPARTFWEALQSLWFYHIALMMDYGNIRVHPGRMDQYLYPYYKKDIEEGILTRDQAQELLECLFVKFNEIVYLSGRDYVKNIPGYATFQSVSCGGITGDGEDGVNELSYMMIQAMMNLNLPEPHLAVKYNKRKNSDSFLREVAKLVACGNGHPQIYNDEAGINYLMELGIPFEEAYNWCPNGCKDLGLAGKWGIPRFPVGINLGAVIELVLLNGETRLTKSKLHVPHIGDPRGFKNFEEFKEATKKQLQYLVKKAVEVSLINESMQEERYPHLLVSLSFEECIEIAKDCTAGGAKYNPGPEIVVVGHADFINSLFAIKKLIYDDKKLTWDELLNALDRNFGGFEYIHQVCLLAPKYGNDIKEVDMLGTEMFRFLCEEVRKYKGRYGGKRLLIGAAAAFHVTAGSVVGALPSGRKAWTPLADGVSPMQGTDVKGPTAVLKSVSRCCLDMYGAPLLNMKLHPSIFKDENGVQAFMGLLKTWYDLGIYHIQFNVVSPEILRDAQKNPEKYRGLMVRVSGYCAYFVNLPKNIQDDIISRTTHVIIS